MEEQRTESSLTQDSNTMSIIKVTFLTLKVIANKYYQGLKIQENHNPKNTQKHIHTHTMKNSIPSSLRLFLISPTCLFYNLAGKHQGNKASALDLENVMIQLKKTLALHKIGEKGGDREECESRERDTILH